MENSLRSILLVEDNPMDVDLTLRVFKKRNINHPVHITRNGEEAINYFKAEAGEVDIPGLVLLDLKLPKVDGFEVLRYIKNDNRYQAIPVVVLTSSSDSGDIKRAYSLGANSYIIKPIEFEQFSEIAAQITQYWGSLNVLPR